MNGIDLLVLHQRILRKVGTNVDYFNTLRLVEWFLLPMRTLFPLPSPQAFMSVLLIDVRISAVKSARRYFGKEVFTEVVVAIAQFGCVSSYQEKQNARVKDRPSHHHDDSFRVTISISPWNLDVRVSEDMSYEFLRNRR